MALWFIVDSQFQSSRDEDPEGQEPLVEWLVFLVTADSYEHAALKAASIARAKEHSYLNAADQRVSWRFLRINDVREMIDQRLADGAEVVSWFSGGPDDDGPRRGAAPGAS